MHGSRVGFGVGGLALLALALAAPAARAASAEDAVLAAEAARAAAFVAADTVALGPVLADELTFGHSNGVVQDKRALLAALAGHEIVYRAIVPSALHAHVYRATATVDGDAAITVEGGGGARTLTLHFLEVWVRRSGRWQLAAYQSVVRPSP